MLKAGPIDSQILLEPAVYSVPPKDVAALDRFQPIFDRLGFEVEAFGDDAVIVRCVPYIFNGPMEAEDFTAMLDLLQDGSMDAARDILLDKMAMMACKAAVKGNHAMTEDEARSLFTQLFASENPYNCPHGRPTVISMSQYEIEKKFKRV
jgi:DNA mismatch repair protein MutL